MHSINRNSAKSYIDKTVNLHLNDGCSIANVLVLRIVENKLIYKAQKTTKPFHKKPKPQSIALKEMSYIQLIDTRLQA